MTRLDISTVDSSSFLLVYTMVSLPSLPSLVAYDSEPCFTDDQTHICNELARLSAKIVEVINTRRFDQPVLQYMAADFHADHESSDGETIISPRLYFNNYKRIARENPNYHIEITRMLPNIDETGESADVWMFLRVTGIGQNGMMVKESVSVLRWKRSKEIWWCFQHSGLRGVGGVT